MNTTPGGQVKLRFSKANGKIDGVKMYCQLQGQTEWQLVGAQNLTPFVDNTPLAQPGVAEIRLYRCRAFIAAEEIGFMSDEVRVTVS